MFHQITYKMKKTSRLEELKIPSNFRIEDESVVEYPGKVPNPFLNETFKVKNSDYLKNSYQQSMECNISGKFFVSLVNAILHHRLVYFMVDESLSYNLFMLDENFEFEQKKHLTDKIGSFICQKVIKIMLSRNVIRKVVSPDLVDGQHAVYQVIDPDLLNEIKPTISEINSNKKMISRYLSIVTK